MFNKWLENLIKLFNENGLYMVQERDGFTSKAIPRDFRNMYSIFFPAFESAVSYAEETIIKLKYYENQIKALFRTDPIILQHERCFSDQERDQYMVEMDFNAYLHKYNVEKIALEIGKIVLSLRETESLVIEKPKMITGQNGCLNLVRSTVEVRRWGGFPAIGKGDGV